MVTKIYIEGELIDLFKDETIEMNSSIADTDDITKINSDYTKGFTVPASDNNNRIFKHYYNADIDNTFDARTKKNAYIELGGLPFRNGKMRLDKVIVKKGKPSSYSINFWGNLVNFKDLIKDDELSSLDFSAFEHLFNSINIKEGLENGLFGGKVVYNLLSKTRQYMYDETPSNNINQPKFVNIAYNGNSRGIKITDLNPSVQLLAIIEAIEDKYGFTFSRDFFGRDEFTNLYMWANSDVKKSPVLKSTKLNFISKSVNNTYLDLTTDVFTMDNTYFEYNPLIGVRYTKYILKLTVVPTSNDPYTINTYESDIRVKQKTITGTHTSEFTFNSLGELYRKVLKVRYEITAETEVTYDCSHQIDYRKQIFSTIIDQVVATALTATQTSSNFVDLAFNMPKIKIIDFLKGIISMFKLVLIPDESGNVYVNNTNDYYKEGTLYDITQYVDYESYDVSRGVIKNKIDFKFKEPKTILNKQFKSNTGIPYGDENANLTDENDIPLDGDSLEVNLPFETVLFERLKNLQDNTLSNIQYGLILDDKLESVNPDPLIFYNDTVQLGTNKLSLINEAGTSVLINTTLNTPAHTLGVDGFDFSVLWGVEFSTWNYSAIDGTLFKNYWQSYVESIFNIKKRNFKYTAYLPIHILTKLKLNDILFIKDRYYRINDFNVNLNTGETELNLINTFENNFGLFLPSSSNVFLSYKEQSTSVFVSNGSVMNIALQDGGFGTAWATVTQSGSNLVITVTENTLIENRVLLINIDNGNGKSFSIVLNQDNKIVTADETFNTADSTILTADAE